MQAIQLKRVLLDAEDKAFARRLAFAHGLSLDDYGKTWKVEGCVIIHLTEEITGQDLSNAAAS